MFSIITTIITNNFNFKIFNKKLIFHNFVIFFIIYCFSKILFWTNFKDFVFYEITSNSRHYEYGSYLELVILSIIILAFIFLSLIIQHSKTKTKNSLVLINVLIIFSLIFFFIESFNTHGFFIDDLGHSKVHWQTYIGPVELMLQGGYLLWDVPSQYGFLSTILIYIMPFDDPWMKLYYLNSLLTFSFSIILFLTIWNKGSFLWLLIAFLITYSVIFLLPGGQWQYNVSSTPSSGMMRFIVSIILIFFVVKIHNRSLLYQVLIITPIWLIGVMWSFESAFYCSCIIFPWIINNIFSKENSINQKVITLLIFPSIFLITVGIISLYYILQIGYLPDYFSFAEYGFSWLTKPDQMINSSPQKFTADGPILVILLLFSMLIYIFKNYKIHNYIILSLIIYLWSVMSLIIGKGEDHHINSIINLFIFSFFLIVKLNFNNHEEFSFKFIFPILIFILLCSYFNPSFFKNTIGVFNNQDYNLSKVIYDDDDKIDILISKINLKNDSIITISSRYWNYYTKKHYQDNLSNIKKEINNNKWLPIYPATLFMPLSNERSKIYINRWIKRKKIEGGWIIYEENSGWHENIIQKIIYSLKNYKITKSFTYQNLKGLYYEKK